MFARCKSYTSRVPNTDHGVTILQDMAQHPYREAKSKRFVSFVYSYWLADARYSRLKDLQRSDIPEVGLAQYPEATAS